MTTAVTFATVTATGANTSRRSAHAAIDEVDAADTIVSERQRAVMAVDLRRDCAK